MMKIQKIAASILFLIIFGQPAAVSQTTDREYFNRGVDHFNKKLYDQANSDYTRAKELARDLDDDQAMDAVGAGPGGTRPGK